jgi:putative SOS response-associated peptidase YedK
MIANMCGRYVLSGDPFSLGTKDNFNVSPGQDMPVKTVDCDGQSMKWGLKTEWQESKLLINARSETYMQKKTFSNCKRCIVPYTGWIEWAAENNQKQPYLLYSDKAYFAGLYDNSGFIILTKEANSNIYHIHNRQPVLLDKYDVGLWFMGDYDVSKTNELIRYHKISKSINKPENNSREYLSEVE